MAFRFYRVQERRKPTLACAKWRKKIRYDNQADADDDAREMAKHYRQAFAAYDCDKCGGYHVGRTNDAQERLGEES